MQRRVHCRRRLPLAFLRRRSAVGRRLDRLRLRDAAANLQRQSQATLGHQFPDPFLELTTDLFQHELVGRQQAQRAVDQARLQRPDPGIEKLWRQLALELGETALPGVLQGSPRRKTEPGSVRRCGRPVYPCQRRRCAACGRFTG